MGCSPTWAGGLWIQEYAAPAMGRTGAGAEAGVDDASTSLYNPASTSRITQSQFMATAVSYGRKLEFDVDRGLGTAEMPALLVRRQVCFTYDPSTIVGVSA